MQSLLRYLLAVIIICTTVFIMSFKDRPLTIFLAGDSTMSIKETKAFPETGWGMPFAYFWDSSVQVINKAKNGRSTKTFISEGLWQSIIEAMHPGDYVFIQFGHNDEVKSKVNTYTTPQEFKANLEKMIGETKSRHGVPVLLTSMARRKFDSLGVVVDTHAEYMRYVKEVAGKTGVAFIDMNKLTMELYQQMGVENSKWLFLHLKSGEHPNYPMGKEDDTHFSELGARLVAQLVLQEIRKLKPELASNVVHPLVR